MKSFDKLSIWFAALLALCLTPSIWGHLGTADLQSRWVNSV